MQAKRKPTAIAFAIAYLVWEGAVRPVWNLNVERVAERNQIDGALAEFAPVTWLREIAAYLPSSFAAGFVVGALIFAYWDTITALFRRHVLRQEASAPEDSEEPAPEKRMGVWIGKVEPYLENIKRDGRFSIVVSGLNFGPENVCLRAVTGSISARFRDRAGNIQPERLNPLVWEDAHDPAQHVFPPRHYGPIFLYQYVTGDLGDRLVSAASRSSGITLDLRDIELIFALERDHEIVKKVKLWDGVRLRAGDFIGSMEVHLS